MMDSKVLATRRSLTLGISFVGAILLVSPDSHAGPSAQDKAIARDLMSEGRELRDRENFAAALKSFQAADAIMRVPTTGLEVATTQVRMGLLVEARETLAKIKALPSTPNEPAPFVSARTRASQLDSELANRIPSIRIRLRGAPTEPAPLVLINGVRVPWSEASSSHRVNPGHHVVAVTPRGHDACEGSADVAENSSVDVEVSCTPIAAPTPVPSVVAPLPHADDARGSRSHSLLIAGLAVGGVGLAVGATTGTIALLSSSSLSSQCPDNKCPPGSWETLQRANTLATVSNIAFIASGLGAIGVVVDLLLPRTDHAPTVGSVKVSPWITSDRAGIKGTF